MIESDLANRSVREMEIVRWQQSDLQSAMDEIAVEEPLEIKAAFYEEGVLRSSNVAVTMRTPGHDHELAIGFLFTEGIITASEQVSRVFHAHAACSRTGGNSISVEFAYGFSPALAKADRNFYTTSSCGVCGKGSIASIRTVNSFLQLEKPTLEVPLQTLYRLPEALALAQANFSATGGIHASGLFDFSGNLIALREDVGRHNALDKLIGYALSSALLPLQNHILVLSGRASFELIQKAAMAGIGCVAAIGAPSSLAVDLAKEFDMTLIGFLRDHRLNIYHAGSHFRITEIYENQNKG